jgi:acylpyruvate hydrolase
VELAVVIGSVSNGRDIPASRALDSIAGYYLSLDMTARNLQDEAKSAGAPWTVAKGFDTFTPLSHFIDKSAITDPSNLRLVLKVFPLNRLMILSSKTGLPKICCLAFPS